MVCSPQQEKVGTGSIEASTYPVYIDLRIRATVSKHGEQSLHDQPRSGRPSTLNATEKELAKQSMKEEPRSLKHVVERFAQKTAKRLSISS
jgi:transposase